MALVLKQPLIMVAAMSAALRVIREADSSELMEATHFVPTNSNCWWPLFVARQFLLEAIEDEIRIRRLIERGA